MPAPQDLSQKIPAPAKIGMQKPQSGGKFSVQIPRVCRGMAMAKIDSCINVPKWNFARNL